MALRPQSRPLRRRQQILVPPLRQLRAAPPRHLPRLLAQLRRARHRRRPSRRRIRLPRKLPPDALHRLRPRHHSLRSRQQLRPTARLRRRRASAASSKKILPTIAMNSSSPPRPATPCGPAPTATGARANICSPRLDASLKRLQTRLRRHLLSPPPRPEHPAGRNHGCPRSRRPLRQSALRRRSAITAACQPPTPPTVCRETQLHQAHPPSTQIQHVRPLDRNGPLPRHRRQWHRHHPFLPRSPKASSPTNISMAPADSRATLGGFLKPDKITPEKIANPQLNALAKTRGQSLAQMALAWVLRLPPSPPPSSAPAAPRKSPKTSPP